MKPHKPVKSFKHKEVKRAHIPSAEEAGYEAQSAKVREAGAIELPLNPVITRGQDPELFWMHKYSSDEKLTAQLDELQAKLKSGDTANARTALENLRDTLTHRYQQPDDESLHVDIRSLYRHEHIAPPHFVDDLSPREDAALVPQERLQHLELDGRHVRRVAAATDFGA